MIPTLIATKVEACQPAASSAHASKLKKSLVEDQINLIKEGES